MVQTVRIEWKYPANEWKADQKAGQREFNLPIVDVLISDEVIKM